MQAKTLEKQNKFFKERIKELEKMVESDSYLIANLVNCISCVYANAMAIKQNGETNGELEHIIDVTYHHLENYKNKKEG